MPADQASGFSALNAAVEVGTTPVVVVDQALVERTLERARRAPRRRARVLLHPGQDDSLHEMLIALPRESCDVPHINFKSGKSFHIVRGEMSVMQFDADGQSATPYRLAAGGERFMLRLNRPYWHTIIPHSDYVVFIETIVGPFTGNRFAPWSPVPDGDPVAWHGFVDSLRHIAQAEAA